MFIEENQHFLPLISAQCSFCALQFACLSCKPLFFGDNRWLNPINPERVMQSSFQMVLKSPCYLEALSENNKFAIHIKVSLCVASTQISGRLMYTRESTNAEARGRIHFRVSLLIHFRVFSYDAPLGSIVQNGLLSSQNPSRTYLLYFK